MSNILKNFRVLEGLDGAGTTTQLRMIDSELSKKGVGHVCTSEPTDSELGKLVRKVLKGEVITTPTALAFLFAADREDHLNNAEKGIVQNINKGLEVYSDRYFFSSLAYQSIGTSYERVWDLNSLFPFPETVIYLDTPVEACIKRIDSRGEKKEIFEKIELLTKVRDNYERVFSSMSNEVKLIRIDGTLTKEEIFQIICKELQL